MVFAPIKKSQAAKARPAVTPQPAPNLPVPGLKGELAVTNDDRAEMLELVEQDCKTTEDFVREIDRLWHQTKVRFLKIGRYLIGAKQVLPHGEYEDFVRNKLPFGPEVGRQIRAVAEAVYLDKRIQEDEVPPSYSIAYQLVTLPGVQLDQARAVGLLKEGVRRKDIISFKRGLAEPKAERGETADGKTDIVASLLEEKKRLLARLREIDSELIAAGVIDSDLVRQ